MSERERTSALRERLQNLEKTGALLGKVVGGTLGMVGKGTSAIAKPVTGAVGKGTGKVVGAIGLPATAAIGAGGTLAAVGAAKGARKAVSKNSLGGQSLPPANFYNTKVGI